MDVLSILQSINEFIEAHGVLLTIIMPGGLIATAFGFLIKIVKKFKRANPYARMEHSLDIINARFIIDNKNMQKCLVDNYVNQRLKCLNSNEEYSTHTLIDEIYKSIKDNSGVYVILGKAGVGKTATMRYMFCQLSKYINNHFIYISMRDIESESSFIKFLDGYTHGRFKPNDGETVTLFLDGLDESLLFSSEQMQLKLPLQETIGEIRKISSSYFDCGCIIVSSRIEAFTSKEVDSLTHRWTGRKIKAYEILKLDRSQILNLYDNLGIIKEKERKMIKRKEDRHFEYAYPEKHEKKKYRTIFCDILDSSIVNGELDSIFQYPLFIKYAYLYMRENNSVNIGSLSSSMSFKKAFDFILDRAILKWDYYVFHNEASQNNPQRFEDFVEIMRNFISEVIAENIDINNNKFTIPSETLKNKLKSLGDKIVKNGDDGLRKEFKGKTATKAIPEYILHSHCLFISSLTGECYEFSHRSFQEYFVAEYLSKRNAKPIDFFKDLLARRKQLFPDEKVKFLLPNKVSDTVKYYLGFLADDIDINNSVSNLQEVLSRISSEIQVSSDNLLTVVCLYTVFPWASSFVYKGQNFTDSDLEIIMEKHRVDIKKTNWIELAALKGLAETELVEQLELSGDIEFKDLQYISQLSTLKRLDIDLADTFLPAWINVLENISMKFVWLCVKIQNEDILEVVINSIKAQKIQMEYMWFRLDSYSSFYIRVYELHKYLMTIKAATKVRVVVWNESEAKARYGSDTENNETALHLMEAVFWLENSSDPSKSTTIYDGLSLCECYLSVDSIDDAKNAFNVYQALSPKKEDKDVYIQYLYRYGIYQVSPSSSDAERMLKEAYPSIPSSQKNRCGCQLLKAYIFNGKLESEETLKMLEELGKSINNSTEIDTQYIDFYYYDMVISISKFRKNINQHTVPAIGNKVSLIMREMYQKGYETISRYSKAADKMNSTYRKFLLCYNVLIFLSSSEFLHIQQDNLEKLLNVASEFDNLHEQQINDDKDERQKQAHSIMYMGSKMLWSLFSKDFDGANKFATELFDYKYRKKESVSNACLFVIDQATKQNLDFDTESIYYTDFIYMLSTWVWI